MHNEVYIVNDDHMQVIQRVGLNGSKSVIRIFSFRILSFITEFVTLLLL